MNYYLLSTKPVLSGSLAGRRTVGRESGFEQISQSDRFVAVRAWTTGTNSTAKGAARLAPLFPKVAGGTLWALVDRSQTWRPRWKRWQWNRVVVSPGCLPAG